MGFALPFLAVPVVELLILAAVESRIGLGWTLGLIVLTAVVGASLLKRQGLGIIRSIRREFSQGALPGTELGHAGLMLVAGAFLLTPGFLTDAVGFTLMVPAIREVVRLRVWNFLRARTVFL